MQIIADRRALHQIPELGLELPKTMAYLRHALEGLNCKVFAPIENSVCAWFDFGKESAIAFRADCDGLPIFEKNQVDYISCHAGRMHACGHDGHMSILLEFARRLSEKKDMNRNVLLIFQPGEETPGGAKPICDTGILKEYGVEAIFGLHLWPGLEAGKVFSRENELMSHASELTVDIYGKSAHLAKAKDGIDAMAAAVELHRLVAQAEAAVPENYYRVMKFGMMTAGTVRNAVSAHAHLEGSLRAFQDEIFEGLRKRMYAIADEVAEKYNCKVEITMSEGYPAVMNPGDLYAKVKELVAVQDLEEPTMTAEDFSWDQRHVPGVFFFLGLGDSPALHSDHFCFDENILLKGAEFFEELAEKYA